MLESDRDRIWKTKHSRRYRFDERGNILNDKRWYQAIQWKGRRRLPTLLYDTTTAVKDETKG
jgi:hypothetical protein